MDDRAGLPVPALATGPAPRMPVRAAVCLLLFGCGADAAPEQPGTIVHPVEDSLASVVASVPVHSASLSGDLTDGEGRVGVLDTASGRIVWFDPSSEGDAEPSAQSVPPARSFDACSIDGRVFALGVRFGENGASSETASTALVHEVDAEGALVRSFSEPYAYLRYPLVADIFGMGRMACDEARGGRIWAAYSALGEVHGLTADGELRWIARLPDLGFPRQAHVPWTRIGSDPGQELLRVEHILYQADPHPRLSVVEAGG